MSPAPPGSFTRASSPSGGSTVRLSVASGMFLQIGMPPRSPGPLPPESPQVGRQTRDGTRCSGAAVSQHDADARKLELLLPLGMNVIVFAGADLVCTHRDLHLPSFLRPHPNFVRVHFISKCMNVARTRGRSELTVAVCNLPGLIAPGGLQDMARADAFLGYCPTRAGEVFA